MLHQACLTRMLDLAYSMNMPNQAFDQTMADVINPVIQVPAQLSSHLRALRKANKLSQAELGTRLRLSQARIARIEGDPLSISVDQLLRVLAALGVRVILESISAGQDSTGRGTATKTRRSTRPKGDW